MSCVLRMKIVIEKKKHLGKWKTEFLTFAVWSTVWHRGAIKVIYLAYISLEEYPPCDTKTLYIQIKIIFLGGKEPLKKFIFA